MQITDLVALVRLILFLSARFIELETEFFNKFALKNYMSKQEFSKRQLPLSLKLWSFVSASDLCKAFYAFMSTLKNSPKKVSCMPGAGPTKTLKPKIHTTLLDDFNWITQASFS